MSSRLLLAPLLATVVLSAAAGPAAPGPPALPEPPDLYAALRQVELRHAGQVRDATFEVDRARIHLQEGELYLTEPVHGIVTGAVFRGEGRFELEPPDAIERHQVKRFLDEERVDLEFEEAVLRFTGDHGERLAALARTGGSDDTDRARRLWRDRHDKALKDRYANLHSRVLEDLLDGDVTPAPFFAGDFDAEGWFTFEVDPRRQEEVQLYRARGDRRPWDVWSGFHSLPEYQTAGRVTDDGERRWPLARHESWSRPYAATEALTDLSIDGERTVEGAAILRIRTQRPTRVLRLAISALIEVTEVRALTGPPDDGWPTAALEAGEARQPELPEGEALPFVQESIGRGLDEDRWEPRVTVALPEAAAPGDEIVLAVRYRGDLVDRLPNRDYLLRDTQAWFPRPLETRRLQLRTVFRTPDNRRVATAGRLVGEAVRDGTRIEARQIDGPVTGMAFHYGDLDPEVHEMQGLPPIHVYRSPNARGFAPGNRERILRDLEGAMRLYADTFGPIPFDSLTLAETPTASGQSFAGFVLISTGVFGAMHTGEAELFRTHELAHQWWGNSVYWPTYHDQWMSEGFAQYAAALHALKVLEDEDKFLDMMEAWRKDVLNRIDVRQSLGLRQYGWGVSVLRDSDGTESGPVWLGARLASDDTPTDYRILAYEKGAWILHMLRMMSYDWESGDDARFRELMTGFYAAHAGSEATTEDFLEHVTAAFGQPMDWFFEQWVYGTEIPTYDPDLDAEREGDGWRLTGSIEQDGVADSFRMPVPIRVRYRDGTSEVLLVEVYGPETEVDLPLRGEPDGVDFDPFAAVLAERR